MDKHIPVLLNEVIENLNINPEGIYVDMTLGGGGHSKAILGMLTTGHLYGFDQDKFAIEFAKDRLKGYKNFTAINTNFSNIKEELAKLNISQVDGILFDLGVSSFQFDKPERGFSYNHDNELDMRMDQTQSLTAKIIVNEYSYEEIVKILFKYGEENFAKSIAKNIIKAREISPINSTFELVDIIKKSMPAKVVNKKGHPAKKTFQALRIAVNDELGVLERTLSEAIDLLKPNGRLAVITFHSLEDRICKTIFRDLSTVYVPKGLPILVDEVPKIKLINKKVITATENELEINNRAHSAKLRVIEKN